MDIKTYWDIAQLSSIKTLNRASKAVEEEFIHLFLKEVRKTLPTAPLMSSSFASKMYLDLVDMQLAKSISQSDQLGIKEYIQKAVKEYEKHSR